MTRRRREAREMTVEEFDDWCSATDKFAETAEAADEVGGPRLSLVPLPEQNVAWPTDLLPPLEALPLDGGGLGGGDSGAPPYVQRHPAMSKIGPLDDGSIFDIPPHQGEGK